MVQISRLRASRTLRSYVAAAVFGIGGANAAMFFSLLNQYISSQPSEPRPDLGLIYQIKNHGSHNYISATQETGLSLMSLTFLSCFLAFIIIIPKNFNGSLPNGRLSMATFDKPSWRTVGLFWVAFCLGVAVLAFAGTWIADAIVSTGIVLHWI